MTIRLSSGLRDAVISNYGLGAMLFRGHIQIYTGEQPASADMPPSGTLLATVTQDGKAAPGDGGLQMKLGPTAGDLVHSGAWVLKGVASGVPGWWRMVGPHADAGELSTFFARLDGSVPEGVQDMPPLITAAMVMPVAGFLLSFPNT